MLNWNRFCADLRRGLNSFNSDTELYIEIYSSFNLMVNYVLQLGMDNSKIRFTETFNVFRFLKHFTTIWESSLKLYSVEVCFYQHANV